MEANGLNVKLNFDDVAIFDDNILVPKDDMKEGPDGELGFSLRDFIVKSRWCPQRRERIKVDFGELQVGTVCHLEFRGPIAELHRRKPVPVK